METRIAGRANAKRIEIRREAAVQTDSVLAEFAREVWQAIATSIR